MSTFYLVRDNREYGPYTSSQIAQMWRDGKITADMYYRAEESDETHPVESLFLPDPAGSPTWVPLDMLDGLRPTGLSDIVNEPAPPRPPVRSSRRRIVLLCLGLVAAAIAIAWLLTSGSAG